MNHPPPHETVARKRIISMIRKRVYSGLFVVAGCVNVPGAVESVPEVRQPFGAGFHVGKRPHL